MNEGMRGRTEGGVRERGRIKEGRSEREVGGRIKEGRKGRRGEGE